MVSQENNLKSASAYLAWFAAALFYYYQYILRVSPGVMVTELRAEFHMTAEQFSSLGALYLYAYSLLQIPLGILIDRIGVRRTVLGSVALCTLGTLMLAWSESLLGAQLSRICIGAGSAGAFMSALKIAADWLPEGKRGLLMGTTLTLGTIGALTAGKPLVWFIDSIGWRSTVVGTAMVGVLVLILVLVLLRLPTKRQREAPKVKWADIGKSVWQIVRNRRVMIYAVLAIGVYTPLSVLADLWGTAFLMQKFQLTRADAAQTSMMMYFGLAIGSLLLPWLCEKWNMLDQAIKLCGFGIFIVFGFILFGPNVGIGGLTALLILLGIFCGAEMMCFTGAVRYTTPETSGMTLGVVNTLNMLGGAILQQAIGFLLDVRWSGQSDAAGVRIYQTHEFVVALSLLLVVVASCCLISLTSHFQPLTPATEDEAKHKAT